MITKPFFCIFLLSIFYISTADQIFGRTFKTLEGVPIEASFVELKSSGAVKIVVLKLDRSGRPYEIPLARLSLSDQNSIKAGAAPKPSGKAVDELALPAPSGPSVFADLSTKLVGVAGSRVKSRKLQKMPDYIVFYFAASWCAPCSRFTPGLVNYYKDNISFANPEFEIIFISRDNSSKEMENYMVKTGMPWPAIRYSDSNREKLRKKYAPSGTPSLVLVDRAGKVISESFVDGNPRGAFAVKADIATWFTEGERRGDSIIKSKLTTDKRVSGR